jgi:hypothetical protein
VLPLPHRLLPIGIGVIYGSSWWWWWWTVRSAGREMKALIRHYFVIISGLVQYLSLYLSHKAEFIEF